MAAAAGAMKCRFNGDWTGGIAGRFCHAEWDSHRSRLAARL